LGFAPAEANAEGRVAGTRRLRGVDGQRRLHQRVGIGVTAAGVVGVERIARGRAPPVTGDQPPPVRFTASPGPSPSTFAIGLDGSVPRLGELPVGSKVPKPGSWTGDLFRPACDPTAALAYRVRAFAILGSVHSKPVRSACDQNVTCDAIAPRAQPVRRVSSQDAQSICSNLDGELASKLHTRQFGRPKFSPRCHYAIIRTLSSVAERHERVVVPSSPMKRSKP
jgi:hypothetical protein